MTKKKPAPETFGLPLDLDLEQAILGSLIVYPEYHIPRARAGGVRDDLQDARHRPIYDAIIVCSDAARAAGASDADVDVGCVRATLETRGQLTEIGGPAYLGILIDKAIPPPK